METADLHVEGMDAYRRVLLFGSLIGIVILRIKFSHEIVTGPSIPGRESIS
jgi:hypothetical protein